jgi:serine/threonine protein kinase
MTPCLDDALLIEVAEGRRVFDAANGAHLARCAACRQAFATAARLAHRPEKISNVPQTRVDLEPNSNEEPSWDELGSGVVVGRRYELERFIGSGASSVVWAARDLRTESRVALKIARPAPAEVLQRLEREARILSTLRHPSIVSALDALPATASRGPAFTMPLLEGETLDECFLRRGKLPLEEACRVAAELAEALTVAHAAGIVHRDLKPQNVFLTPERAMILDFGIAKRPPSAAHSSQITRSGVMLGTLSTMAPEQWSGERDIDARADLWALGAMLYRALTSCTLPSIQRNPERYVAREPVIDRGALAAFPEAIVRLLERMLMPHRDDRLGDAREAVDVLRYFAR